MSALPNNVANVLKRAFNQTVEEVASKAAGQSAGKEASQRARNRQPDPNLRISETRTLRFVADRQLKSMRETEQLADYFRQYGRLLAYRVNRVGNT
jgi:hypothetical protein